ncbi:MAG: dehydro coenzyme reductase / coenzyme F420-0:L-glutamate ligase / coenzyme, partial [Trebonia sp.]|nr:dehydro coenzyme reductase / coenzyme F420-0:L-glutamate ligase / coenzyme [Trebonia sp.]
MTKAPSAGSSGTPATPGQAPDPVQVYGIAGIPEIAPGADLAGLHADAVTAPGGPGMKDGDILVVTSKVVSMAEGRVAAMT